MSFVVSAVVATVATVVGAGYSIHNGAMAAKSQESAAKKAEMDAKKQADIADQQQNRANARNPDMGGISSANSLTGSSTMLTGATGIDPNKLLLGKSTLLGG